MQSASEAALLSEWCSAPRSATVSPRLLRQLALEPLPKQWQERRNICTLHSHLLWFCPQKIWIMFHVRQVSFRCVYEGHVPWHFKFRYLCFYAYCVFSIKGRASLLGAVLWKPNEGCSPSKCVCWSEGKRINNSYIPRSLPPSSLSFTAINK